MLSEIIVETILISVIVLYLIIIDTRYVLLTVVYAYIFYSLITDCQCCAKDIFVYNILALIFIFICVLFDKRFGILLILYALVNMLYQKKCECEPPVFDTETEPVPVTPTQHVRIILTGDFRTITESDTNNFINAALSDITSGYNLGSWTAISFVIVSENVAIFDASIRSVATMQTIQQALDQITWTNVQQTNELGSVQSIVEIDSTAFTTPVPDADPGTDTEVVVNNITVDLTNSVNGPNSTETVNTYSYNLETLLVVNYDHSGVLWIVYPLRDKLNYETSFKSGLIPTAIVPTGNNTIDNSATNFVIDNVHIRPPIDFGTSIPDQIVMHKTLSYNQGMCYAVITDTDGCKLLSFFPNIYSDVGDELLLELGIDPGNRSFTRYVNLNPGTYTNSDLVINGNIIYVCSNEGVITAANTVTMQIIWNSIVSINNVTATVVVTDKHVIAGTNTGSIIKISKTTGNVLSTVNVGPYTCTALNVYNDICYVNTRDNLDNGRLHRVNLTSMSVTKSTIVYEGYYSSVQPVMHDNEIIVCYHDCIVFLNHVSLRIKTVINVSDYIAKKGIPFITNDHIHISTLSGFFIAINLTTYTCSIKYQMDYTFSQFVNNGDGTLSITPTRQGYNPISNSGNLPVPVPGRQSVCTVRIGIFYYLVYSMAAFE